MRGFLKRGHLQFVAIPVYLGAINVELLDVELDAAVCSSSVIPIRRRICHGGTGERRSCGIKLMLGRLYYVVL